MRPHPIFRKRPVLPIVDRQQPRKKFGAPPCIMLNASLQLKNFTLLFHILLINYKDDATYPNR